MVAVKSQKINEKLSKLRPFQIFKKKICLTIKLNYMKTAAAAAFNL